MTSGSIGGNGSITLLQNSVEYGFVCIRGSGSSGMTLTRRLAEGSADLVCSQNEIYDIGTKILKIMDLRPKCLFRFVNQRFLAQSPRNAT